MASSYSLDLRERVFGAWQSGEGSQSQIAARFGVGVSFVRDLSRRWRERRGGSQGTRFLLPHLWPGAVAVMDNLGAHKVKGVKEAMEAARAPRLYLSPYSADFNPIEMAWSKLKAYLRATAARTTAALDKAIGEGWRTISAQDARGYFAHCGYVQGLPK